MNLILLINTAPTPSRPFAATPYAGAQLQRENIRKMCNMCTREIRPIEDASRVPEQLKGLKMKHDLHTDPEDEVKQKEVEYQPDLLAFSTQRLRVAYDVGKRKFAKFQDTKTYVMLTRTWQPLHIALAAAITAAWLMGGAGSVRPWRALYVAAVAIHLGTQVWMTLVSGLVLYFSLPRHEFGRVQTALFPVYYVFNALVSFVALLSYLKLHSITRFQHISWIQVALLLTVVTIEAFIRLRLVKPMLRYKHIKTQMEEAAGGGREVGKLILGELAHCPRYMKVLKTFRSYHSTIAAGTMVSMGCSVYSIMILIDSMCGI